MKLRQLRIGLWDRYGGSIPAGWIRWILEKFGFSFEVVYAPELDAGRLETRFDVLIFATGAIPPVGSQGRQDEDADRAPGRERIDPLTIPEEYRSRLGNITPEKTIVELKKFVEAGGTVITIGTSANLAYHFGLPISSALVERQKDGLERPLQRNQFYVPGSIMRVRVDRDNPLAYGITDPVDVFFDDSPVFRLGPVAALKGVRPVAWFEGRSTLRSGWALGQGYLDQGVAIVEVALGKGKIILCGPEITFRAQPHGTFKFLFNAIYAGSAERKVQ